LFCDFHKNIPLFFFENCYNRVLQHTVFLFNENKKSLMLQGHQAFGSGKNFLLSLPAAK